MRSLKKRGYDAERELVKKFRTAGFKALRIPVSAPSNEPFPDVFAVQDDVIIAVEVKSHIKYAYYKKKQVEKLFEFLNIHSIYPNRLAVLAAKFKYKGWRFKIADKSDDFSLRVGSDLSFKDLLKSLS